MFPYPPREVENPVLTFENHPIAMSVLGIEDEEAPVVAVTLLTPPSPLPQHTDGFEGSAPVKVAAPT